MRMEHKFVPYAHYLRPSSRSQKNQPGRKSKGLSIYLCVHRYLRTFLCAGTTVSRYTDPLPLQWMVGSNNHKHKSSTGASQRVRAE